MLRRVAQSNLGEDVRDVGRHVFGDKHSALPIEALSAPLRDHGELLAFRRLIE
jgi:hypothetical protein